MPTDGEGLPADVNVGGMDRMLISRSRADRLAERAAIVAYLRRRARAIPAGGLQPSHASTTAVYVASLEGEADRIERGEHEANS